MNFPKSILYSFFILIGSCFSISYLAKNDFPFLDRCNQDRFTATHNPFLPELSGKLVFMTAITMAIFFVLQIMLLKPKKEIKRFEYVKSSVFVFLIVYLNFTISYSILLILKDLLGDETCNKKPNSISGHLHFFVYWIFALPLFFWHSSKQSLTDHIEDQEDKKASSLETKGLCSTILANQGYKKALLISTYFFLIVSSVVSCAKTYYGGYHSPRQMIYGSILAFISQSICVVITNFQIKGLLLIGTFCYSFLLFIIMYLSRIIPRYTKIDLLILSFMLITLIVLMRAKKKTKSRTKVTPETKNK
ncbi:hypothetical protein M0812_08552 [Anaeramoeba flamelloides]|uniref:Phosphatidic acid phosphatase type 2/haloperoxidase domain-containing protein n=1 Tax=Anaeramoeba flamelloides TaxID=1746091 RepID=A0AAV7ZZK4_9EUKA|nr:hypothetical protein M0812_08552 [Anaeramoeba flamelloides]